MDINAEARAFLDRIKDKPTFESLPVAKARSLFREIASIAASPPADLHKITDMELPVPGRQIPVRIYRPGDEDNLPVMVYFHGGGWVIGDLETHDSFCRSLAKTGGFVVIAVDYRLAPEHKFPVAHEDCMAATSWIAANGAVLAVDTSRLVVAGDSAGATMAAAVCQQAAREGQPNIKYQVLLQPVTDIPTPYPSKEEYAEGHFLTTTLVQWAAGHYLNSLEEAGDVRMSPNLAESLSDLPAALMLIGTHDMLHSECEAYARHLEKDGVDVNLSIYPGQIHDFMMFDGIIGDGKKAIEEICSAVNEAITL